MRAFSFNPPATAWEKYDFMIEQVKSDKSVKFDKVRDYLSEYYMRVIEYSGNGTYVPNVALFAFKAEENVQKNRRQQGTLSLLSTGDFEDAADGNPKKMKNALNVDTLDITKYDNDINCAYEISTVFMDEMLYKNRINEFRDCREYLFLEENVDIVRTILDCREGNDTVQQLLKDLMKRYTGLKELIVDVIQGGTWTTDLANMLDEPIVELNNIFI